MKIKHFISLLIITGTSAYAMSKAPDPSAGTEEFVDSRIPDELSYQKGAFTPDGESLTSQYKVPDWYRNGKFGIWVHASPQDEAEAGDWFAHNLYIERAVGSRAVGSGLDIRHSVVFGSPTRPPLTLHPTSTASQSASAAY